jgi:hypothetical protein
VSKLNFKYSVPAAYEIRVEINVQKTISINLFSFTDYEIQYSTVTYNSTKTRTLLLKITEHFHSFDALKKIKAIPVTGRGDL